MREKIREAIYEAIREKSGYEALEARTGFVAYLNSDALQLPCAWLCPLSLTAKTGRREGLKTYSGVMYLMETVEGLEAEQKDAAWDRMEQAALDILESVVGAPGTGIAAVENMRCDPDEYALTGYNTISVVVRFDVKVKYCENRG